MRSVTRLAAAAAGLVLATAGCVAGTRPAPGASGSTGPITLPGASHSTPASLDLTAPGVAQRIVRELVTASGQSQVILVTLRADEAAVSVLVGGKPHTWAYRQGAIKEISTDLAYVEQVAFDPDRFDLSDVGRLFREAAQIAGSAEGQQLQIVDLQRVDHSLADVKMSVSTNPETRTVFFNADGSLVPTLDLRTETGIAAGLTDARGAHTSATAVGIDPTVGVYVEFPGTQPNTLVRRSRAPRFPVLANARSGADRHPLFDPRRVTSGAIWRVLQRSAANGQFGPTTVWSMVIDRRDDSPEPRMHFTIGGVRVVTDLTGAPVT